MTAEAFGSTLSASQNERSPERTAKMFAGLFVIAAGLESAVVMPEIIAGAARFNLDATPVLATITAVLSNLVRNVPAVLVLKPFVVASAIPARDSSSPWPRR